MFPLDLDPNIVKKINLYGESKSKSRPKKHCKWSNPEGLLLKAFCWMAIVKAVCILKGECHTFSNASNKGYGNDLYVADSESQGT